MTAHKQQPNPRRTKGNPIAARRDSGVEANGVKRTSSCAHFGSGPEEPACRLPVCRYLVPANIQLAGLRVPAPAEIQSPAVPIPIWLAALMATHCQVRANGEDRDVSWDCISGRAVYTNRGAEVEIIEPLGVCLQGGHTVVVCWIPGETTYTVEVFGEFDCVA
jgi:hypothetical protein